MGCFYFVFAWLLLQCFIFAGFSFHKAAPTLFHFCRLLLLSVFASYFYCQFLQVTSIFVLFLTGYFYFVLFSWFTAALFCFCGLL